MRQKNCNLLQTFKKFLKLICYYLSGQAPTDVVGIIMELLRAVVVLLGVSMFFSIITSVLTASEELRVIFHLENASIPRKRVQRTYKETCAVKKRLKRKIQAEE